MHHDSAPRAGSSAGPSFDVGTLREEVVRVWGEYGAHVEVLDELLRRAACDCYPDLADHEGSCPRRNSPILQRLQNSPARRDGQPDTPGGN